MIPFKRYLGKDFSIWIPIIFILATVLRVLFLDTKPAHFDEGVNGWFVEQIKANGKFDYNPENFHGPLYFYLLFLFDIVLGSEVYVHRLVAALCSLGAMYVFYKSLDIWSETKSNLSLFAIAVSPALVFYARYSIHESLLLLGFSLWLYGWVHLLSKNNQKSLWLLAFGFLIMALTKETFIVFVINSGIAYVVVRFLQRKPIGGDYANLKNLTYPLVMVVVGIVFFFSELFTSFNEVKEFFTAFSIWKDTGFKHTGHEKSFYYWLHLLFRYEWLFLVGLLLSFQAIKTKNIKMQFVAVYAFGNILAFSLIAYKTPWCILALLLPYAYFLQTSKKWLLTSLWLIALAMLGNTLRLNFKDYANPKEMYVYVQTSPKMKEVVDPLRAWVKNDPRNRNVLFLIQTSSEWPLPWLLKDFLSTSYTPTLPSDWERYDLLIVSKNVQARLGDKLSGYMTKDFQIRYEQEQSVLLISPRRPDIRNLFETNKL
jgi:uncharacterized protein (TIGR03663 family)